jgi:hypothetical protein
MNPTVRFVEYFGKLETGSATSEEEFRALKHGETILVQLDGPEPELRKFAGFGLRHLLIAKVTWGTITTTFSSRPLIPKNHTLNTIATPLTDPDFAEEPRANEVSNASRFTAFIRRDHPNPLVRAFVGEASRLTFRVETIG